MDVQKGDRTQHTPRGWTHAYTHGGRVESRDDWLIPSIHPPTDRPHPFGTSIKRPSNRSIGRAADHSINTKAHSAQAKFKPIKDTTTPRSSIAGGCRWGGKTREVPLERLAQARSRVSLASTSLLPSLARRPRRPPGGPRPRRRRRRRAQGARLLFLCLVSVCPVLERFFSLLRIYHHDRSFFFPQRRPGPSPPYARRMGRFGPRDSAVELG